MLMKFSIITPTYNSADTIIQCVNSVLNQNHNNFEHIIVDGNSTDDTLMKIAGFSHLKLIVEDDEGIYDAVNKGLMLASGDLVTVLNSDDFYINSCVFSEVQRSFVEDGALEVFSSGVEIVDKASAKIVVRRWVPSMPKTKSLQFGWMAPHPGMFIKRQTMEKLNGFSRSYKISSDYDFIVRLFKNKNVNYKINQSIFVRMRMGGASNNGLRAFRDKSIEDCRIASRNGLWGGLTILFKLARKLIQIRPYFFVVLVVSLGASCRKLVSIGNNGIK